jgi:molecular chaperone HscC
MMGDVELEEARFHTLTPNQRSLLVEVFQGEHSLCRDNTKLGEYSINRLPPGRAGEVWVDVRFTYDLNGILEVEMRIMDSDRVEHLVIEKRPGKLSKNEIASAREQMQRIKFHPRDSLPNRTALARADALFAELTGYAREELGQALALFRAVLETQDASQIDSARQQLNALVDVLRR